MPYILTSQTSENEATSQLASPCGEARRATFLMLRMSHEASQLARIVNEASVLSITLTHLAPNSPCLASWPSLDYIIVWTVHYIILEHSISTMNILQTIEH